jgi:hypothetical protein
MGDYGCRIESGEDLAQAKGEPGLEALRVAVARRVLEGQVKFHLERAIEKAEKTVANLTRLVQSVDQTSRRALCTSASWRGYDVNDQRTPIVTEMRRHLLASFLWL